MKRIWAVVAGVTLSGACLFLLERSGNVKFENLTPILSEHRPLLFMTAGCQVAASLLSAWRYRLLLACLGLRVPFAHVVGPTLIGLAIGVWLPASLAAAEVVRFGLMLGLSGGAEATNTPDARARVALASLLDRVVGMATMLVVGGTIGVTLAVTKNPSVRLAGALGAVSAISVALGLGLMLLPVLGGGGWLKGIVARLAAIQATRFGRPIAKLARFSEHIIDGVRKLLAHPRGALGPAFLSAVILALVSLSLYLPGLATPVPPSFFAAIVGMPLLALSQVLPLGFAGLGSQQALTLGLFSTFHVDDASVTSASLIQNGVSVVTITLLGAVASTFLARDLLKLRRTLASRTADAGPRGQSRGAI